jgi:hypothetical protein
MLGKVFIDEELVAMLAPSGFGSASSTMDISMIVSA